MWILDKREYRQQLKDARLQAKDCREICGLIVDTGVHLSLVRTRNIAKRLCGFNLSTKDVRRISCAVDVLDQVIVGSFHSHPFSDARPGPSDISGTIDNSLMLVFDCSRNTGELWNVKNGKARKLKYQFIQDIIKR